MKAILVLLLTWFFCINSHALDGFDVKPFVALMEDLNGLNVLGTLEVKETLHEKEVELSEPNKGLSGRECLVRFSRFTGTSLDYSTMPMSRRFNNYVSNNILLDYEGLGELMHLPIMYNEKFYHHFSIFVGASLKEQGNGVSIIGKFDNAPALVTVTLPNAEDAGGTAGSAEGPRNGSGVQSPRGAIKDQRVTTIKVRNFHNLDWGPHSLMTETEVKLIDMVPIEIRSSLIVMPKYRENPPVGYTLPNDFHYICRPQWQGV